MKRFSALLCALVFALVLGTAPAWAALADVPNKTVTVTDLGDRVQFAITFAFSATDSTNDLTSKGIYLYGLQVEGGTIQVVADGETGRDVNIFVRGGFNTTALASFTSYSDRSYWDDFSADATNSNSLFHASELYLDHETLNSASSDSSITKVIDAAFLGAAIVFEVDGQPGNTVTTGTNSTTIYLTLKKDMSVRVPAYNAAVMTFSTT